MKQIYVNPMMTIFSAAVEDILTKSPIDNIGKDSFVLDLNEPIE